MTQPATSVFDQAMDLHLEVARATRALAPQVAQAAQMMSECLSQGGQILFCGNGGSAADAQHLAAEFVGRFLKERRALPAQALSVNTSILTAIGNDYGYERVFARQVEAMGKPGDVLVGITTSGNSPNILAAALAARAAGLKVIGMTGEGGGKLAAFCDLLLAVPSQSTPRIQEMHILIGHSFCQMVEEALL